MKAKKLFLTSFFVLVAASLSACQLPFGKKESAKSRIYWKNYDGSILEMDEFSGLQIPEYNGKTPTKPTDDAATYEFAGWDKEIGVVLSTTEYVATFKSTPREYKVHWLNYNNSELAVSTVAYGSIPEYPGETPTRNDGGLAFDYEFAGWDRELAPVKGECSYKATYRETSYQVVSFTYIFNETVHEVVNENTKSARAGTTITLQDASCAGYDFAGFFLDSAHTKPVSSLPNVSDNKILYGKFDVHTYNISYELVNGELEGSNPSTITCLQEAELINPTKVGYEFTTWKDQHGKSLTKLSDVCEDLTLTATYSANQYVITLRYQEQDDVYMNVRYEGPVNLPQLHKNGYEFLGWFYEDDLDTKFELTSYTLLHDISLVQKWSNPITYTITYNLDGGTNEDGAPEEYSAINQPALPTPTKEGYTFQGWYDGNTKVELLRGIFKNITLTAHWSANDVNITYDYDGGSLQRSVRFYDGAALQKEVKVSPFEYAKYEVLADKEDAQFNGWYNENSIRESFASDKTVEKDVAFFAQWAPISSSDVGATIGEDVQFEANGFNNKCFQYTPLVNQIVTFESAGDIDVDAKLIQKSNGKVLKEDQDSGEEANFSFQYNLTANTTYLLKVSSNYEGSAIATIKTTSVEEHLAPQGRFNSTAYTIDSSKQKFDAKFASVGNPVKEGFVFNGWVDADDNTPYEDGSTTLKKELINLKATWIDA